MIEVAQATVSIVPNMKGAQEKIAKDLGADKAGSTAGKGLGSSMMTAVKGAIGAAAIGKFIGDSLKAGADLQQSLGGVETMFKENADIVKGYASEAYKTAGVSANDYMQSVTSFSAALIKSMDGDTAAAAEMANTAMIDMSDNANKMGTDMAAIQTAYQGFAKQNYTMLDNLKLGYGGTKTEMERLLADASKLSGVEYNIDNLSDVYEAIHVIQEDLGITGTTAKESAETFSGSFQSMKAAAEDLMGNLSLGNDIMPQIENLGGAIQTFVVGNLLPMVSNVVQNIPTLLGQLPGFIAELIPQILPMAGEMVMGLAQGIVENIPVFVAGIGDMIDGAIDALIHTDWAQVGSDIVDLINEGWQALTQAATDLWEQVKATFTSVIETVPIVSEAWNAITETATAIWEGIVGFFTGEISVSEILTEAWDIITTTAETLWENVKAVFEAAISVVDIITEAWDKIFDIASELWESIVGVFTGEISVADLVTDAWEALQGIAETYWNAAKAVFETVAPAVKEVMTRNWGLLRSTASRFWEGAKGVFEKTQAKVKEINTALWSNLETTASDAFNAAKAKFEEVAPKVKEVATDAWDNLTDTATDIWDGIKEIFSSFEIEWPDFGEMASKAFEGLKSAAQSAWDWVKGLFGGGADDETVEAVHGSTEEMERALAECSLVIADVDSSSIDTANAFVVDSVSDWETTVSGASLAIPAITTSALTTVSSAITAAVASWKAAMNFSWSIPAPHGALPSFSVSMQSVTSPDGKTTASYPVFSVGTKWYAQGGIFQQPTIIGVGEAGAEAALPLDSFWRRLDAEFDRSNTGATINNYIEVNGATDPITYADELARELQQQLKRA